LFLISEVNMDFVHPTYIPGETIAAVATPAGEGGVAIIRISGAQAIDVAKKLFSGPVATYQSHTVHYGSIRNAKGEELDRGLLIPMLGQRSFTGEDTVEIHCHGGALITRRILEAVLQAGARAARPGEFTLKAFINGKIDLAQAEAVQGLICAKNEHALDVAAEQLKGSLSTAIQSFQRNLTEVAAILEAWVDFPEEGLEFASMSDVCQILEKHCDEMQRLADTFQNGRIIHEGLQVCLVGSPNVGKSSLLNALLDKERAIVSSVPGTTRDILEDHVRLNGLNLKLLDTAGIRDTEEIIELEGIRRSKEAMHKSDLILLVLDASKGLTDQDRALLELVSAVKTVLIWNKSDLPHQPVPLVLAHQVKLSAKTRIGLEELHQKIEELIWQSGPPSREELLITNVRHQEALLQAIYACHQVIEGLKNGASPEFISMDMRLTLTSLGKIIGTNITEDILSAIFSKFCIGK
jgi:tRNA modification GTPase